MIEQILLVEDDPEMLALTRGVLKDGGYKVHDVGSVEQALEFVRRRLPDLIVSDVQLPGLSGVKFCQILKGEPRTAHVPIILLTVLGKEMDKVQGLKTGADDYLTKPYSARELLARVEAVLRRVRNAGAPVQAYKFKDLTVNMDQHEVLISGKPVNLRRKEYDLLLLLIHKKSHALTREQIVHAIWKDDVIVTSNTLNVLVNSLRQKLGPYANLVQTIVGEGYRLNENFKP